MFADSNWVSSVLTKKDQDEVLKVSEKILDQNIELELDQFNNKSLDPEKLDLPKSSFGNGNVNYVIFEKIM